MIAERVRKRAAKLAFAIALSLHWLLEYPMVATLGAVEGLLCKVMHWEAL